MREPNSQDSGEGLRLIGHLRLDGRSGWMQISIKDGYAFLGHMGSEGTAIVDVRDPRSPRLVGDLPAPPNTHGHKTQIVDDVLVVNRERLPPVQGGREDIPWTAGIEVFDVSDPTAPAPLSRWLCGGRGVHRMTYWSRPYVYASAGWPDQQWESLAVIDLSDPRSPQQVGSWALPGMRLDEADVRSWGEHEKVTLHHGIPRGDRLYCGLWDAGMAILDISDPTRPGLVSQLQFEGGRNTHSVCPLPGRELLAVTDECTVTELGDYRFQVRLVDVSDERAPRVVSELPVPEGDFAELPGRFGPHNVHEPRPGTLQDGNTLYVTYFNAGLRVYDVSDAGSPREVAWFVPARPSGLPSIQMNDVLATEDGLIYATCRAGGGLYVFERM